MTVCVIGAGVIGMATAYALARRGFEVTVVDEGNEVGRGTSYANGAQLSYSYVAPLADASVWKALPGYLLCPDSPLTWRPTLDWQQWIWIARFLRACNARAAENTTKELLKLAFFSKSCLEELQGALRLDFSHRTAGKLVMLSEKKDMEKAKRQVALQASLGCEQEVLPIDRCIDIEPTLARPGKRWAGGVYTASEQVGDCAKFCHELAGVLKTRYGAQIRLATPVTGAWIGGNRINGLHTPQGAIEADAYVLANGVGAASLGKSLGLRLPVYPLKGYSVTLEAAVNPADLPSVSITDLARKVVYARVGNRLRVAGRAELVGNDLTVDRERCRQLAQEAASLFHARADSDDDIAPWAGLRPATPTGLPIIGATPLSNLWTNVGHGALGWTLACGSGELIARQMNGEQGPIDTTAFLYQH
ncbi:MAG TPA: D-amino acid dehydrogenase [Noviherbaspirillum sp.]|nr:D-amino acid dehydrogenase [Noviherbaspirillum sp.]